MVHLSRKYSSEEDQRANSHDEDKVSRWTVRRVPSGSTGVHQGACLYVRRTFKEKDEVTVRRRGTAKERKRERRELKDGGSCSSKRKETEG